MIDGFSNQVAPKIQKEYSKYSGILHSSLLQKFPDRVSYFLTWIERFNKVREFTRFRSSNLITNMSSPLQRPRQRELWVCDSYRADKCIECLVPCQGLFPYPSFRFFKMTRNKLWIITKHIICLHTFIERVIHSIRVPCQGLFPYSALRFLKRLVTSCE